MWSVIPVAFIAVPLTAARLIWSSKLLQWSALLLLGAHLVTRGYRPGEGPLSPKMRVTIAPGKDVGGLLYELTAKFRGVTFSMTKSEAVSLALLLDAANKDEIAIPALEDYLQNFPMNRRLNAVEG